MNCLEQAYTSLGCNQHTEHPDFNKAFDLVLVSTVRYNWAGTQVFLLNPDAVLL